MAGFVIDIFTKYVTGKLMYGKKVLYTLVLSILLTISLAGCTSVKSLFAMARSTDHFLTLDSNPALKYEPGAEERALKVAAYLDRAIQTVESRQYAAFPGGVSVYMTDSVESFSSYCTSTKPSGCVIGGRLFLSPKMFTQGRRGEPLLIHELSHLHLSQQMGRWNYQTKIPSWFSEGLAVYVADGAGAEKVSKREAMHAIRRGESIKPNASGSLLFKKTASDFGLTPHMFYRQSSLYVTWLHDLNQDDFKRVLTRLYQGKSVEQAMLDSYGFGVLEGWKRFVEARQITCIRSLPTDPAIASIDRLMDGKW